jgi:hypothetical protein
MPTLALLADIGAPAVRTTLSADAIRTEDISS